MKRMPGLLVLCAAFCGAHAEDAPLPSFNVESKIQGFFNDQKTFQAPKAEHSPVNQVAAASFFPAERWRISRNADQRQAVATALGDATLGQLARQAGLSPKERVFWAGVIKNEKIKTAAGEDASWNQLALDTRIQAGQRILIPNVILALWVGDLGKTGELSVNWKSDLKRLEAEGFYVEEWNKEAFADGVDLNSSFRKTALKKLSERKQLLGLFVTGHGSRTAICACTVQFKLKHFRPEFC